MSRLISLLLLPLLLLLAGNAAAQRVWEERIPVRNLKPSKILDRIDVLAGLPSGGSRGIDIRPDDATNTIVVRMSENYKDEIERDRLMLILKDFVSHVDRPEPPLAVDLYVVQTNLLSDEEFKVLDETLKNRPLALERGSTAKGVVFYKQLRAENQEVFSINDQLREARATTRPEPVRLEGKLMPALRAPNTVFISTSMKITAVDRPLAPGRMDLVVSGKAETTNTKPMVIFAGEMKRLADPAMETFPTRHEIMVYIWATPEVNP